MANDDAVSPLLQGAISAHELYSVYVQAGFTEAQAMQLIIAMLTASAQAMPAHLWTPPQDGKG